MPRNPRKIFEENDIDAIYYKIMGGKGYTVFRKEWKGKTYYNIQVTQKQYNGVVEKYDRPVIFRKGVELDNGTRIIIRKAMENLRRNPKDPYNPITSLMILEFDLEGKKDYEQEREAYKEYRESLEGKMPNKKQEEELFKFEENLNLDDEDYDLPF